MKLYLLSVMLIVWSLAPVGRAANEDPLKDFRFIPDLKAPEGGGDPLKPIGQLMEGVANDLVDRRTGPDVRSRQKQIVAALDKVIEQLQQSCQQSSGKSGGSNPTKPLNSSRIVGGPGGVGPLREPDKTGPKWGELPPKEREKIMQSLQEGFPQGYEQVLQDYYQRLAQPTGGAPASTTQP